MQNYNFFKNYSFVQNNKNLKFLLFCNYNKIIKIYDFDNMNFSKDMENKIKKFVYSININIQYGKHVEIFQIDNINLNNIITKIDKIKLDIIKDIDKDTNHNFNFDQTIKIEEEKTLIKIKKIFFYFY